MHLFNPFFDNFAEEFRLVNFPEFFKQILSSVRTEVEASLRARLHKSGASASHIRRKLCLTNFGPERRTVNSEQ
jgi:hypothetical protein